MSTTNMTSTLSSNKFAWLLKREFWEYRGGFFMAPLITTLVMLAIMLLVLVTAEFKAHQHGIQLGGMNLDQVVEHIGAGDVAKVHAAVDIGLMGMSVPIGIVFSFVVFFYLLGALYNDRADRSVLFWKSLPVTDGATVTSKVLTAMFVAPAIAFAISTIAYVVFLVLVTLWAAVHGVNALPAIFASHPIGMFGRLLLTIPVDALWALPTIGWLLFWSSFARSKPFLWAVILPIVVVALNGWFGVLGLPHVGGEIALKNVVGRLLLSVMPGSWLTSDGVSLGGHHMTFGMDDEHVLSSFDPSRIYGITATTGMWIGIAAGIALIAAAIWFRGRRIETSV